jgi:hypothetical protein
LPQADITEPSWALVGSLSASVPYFYYILPFVPYGYKEGWNSLEAVLGTYDLTRDTLSVFDRYLLTEYNVSNNHSQRAFVYCPLWMRIPYQEGFDTYQEGTLYKPYDCVRVEGFTDWAFEARFPVGEAPVALYADTNRFTLETALQACPEEYRLLGLKLTFVSVYTAQSETWMFLGADTTQWTDLKQWVRLNLRAEENQVTAEVLGEPEYQSPVVTVDRAVADALGNDIADTYLTKAAAAAFIENLLHERGIL